MVFSKMCERISIPNTSLFFRLSIIATISDGIFTCQSFSRHDVSTFKPQRTFTVSIILFFAARSTGAFPSLLKKQSITILLFVYLKIQTYPLN